MELSTMANCPHQALHRSRQTTKQFHRIIYFSIYGVLNKKKNTTKCMPLEAKDAK
jgi:hypothetical protein